MKQINKFIEMAICVAVDCKYDSRQGKAWSMCHAYCFGLKKDEISVGLKQDVLPHPTNPHPPTIKAPLKNKN